MKKFLVLLTAALALTACGKKAGKSTREQLDSMKAAARLADSLDYIHARDSLPLLQQEVQAQTAALASAKGACTRVINPDYQDQGEWYSRACNNKEGQRTTLDAFMTDDGAHTLRSTIVGKKSGSKKLTLSSGAEELMASEGDYYDFDVDGHHELLTYTGRTSLDLFDFLKTHSPIRVRVGSVCYTLSESDRKALLQVYTLALAQDAQRRSEFNLRKAQTRVEDWQNQHP